MDHLQHRFGARALTGWLGLFGIAPVHAAAVQVSHLADMSIEELVNIEITSVSRKAERLADAAASVFVITGEEIRRSGVTTLPEALRLAPNLQVAQSSASSYAINARGLSASSNKLLVLIDGRSVYTPVHSGVFWDMQDVLLEDVDRIEVISGPGATLWGVNAVNGVINIITQSAKDTQGSLVAAGAGNRGNATAFRHGGTLGADTSYRLYGKYLDHESSKKEDGSKVHDAWHRSQIGFRADWANSNDRWTVLGNAYEGSSAQPVAPSSTVARDTNTFSGTNLAAHWARQLDGGASLSLQAYYDHTKRTVPPIFGQSLGIFDVQAQHALAPAGSHAMVWGMQYRQSRDRNANSVQLAFLPANVNQQWTALFAQDEIRLRENLRLTMGARVEHNDYTGNEFLPSARLAWKLAPDHLLWTAASRTVRAPARLDVDTYSPAQPPFVIAGGPLVRSEVARVFEVGYRGQPAARVSFSATLFRTTYDHLLTLERAPSGVFTFENKMQGRAHGIEMWGNYQATPRWRLSAGLTALKEKLWLKPGGTALTTPGATAGKDPSHTWTVRSAWNIAADRELDLAVRHVASLSNPSVSAYTALDARFAWKLRPDLELSVTGQNLFSRHSEYGAVNTRSELPANVFVKLLWQN
ncbi:MAG TPA: TonB-dependent receptor [Burkholderiaceae bacterium]|nr:TonB-dependent receptor [Burkholderiaceae bacterium]